MSNRLIKETSPYLLQHAHNPVDWYPWGPEALAAARTEDKPILLSIGYSACHWCHVMEHESFENPAIARVMNDSFICIKVDREERPDLDAIYMNAVQMMTGHGGWPLTVFLTPELKPFYGGTYFPPEDRRGMPGFPRVLASVADAFSARRSEIAGSADAITVELGRMDRFHQSSEMLTTEVLDRAFAGLMNGFDSRNGGFGSAPKFPPSMALMTLLRQYKRTNSTTALEMAQLTLDRMAGGGMYDHLGGGFHRYSVDEHWLVPHFEKMLYDNALLARVYLYAFQTTRERVYADVVEEILEYVLRDMTSPLGGFYSSEDADSDGEEGKFYTWSPDEIAAILGAEEAPLICEYFDVTRDGNFEHRRSIINTPIPLEEFAAGKGIAPGDFRAALRKARKKLFYARQERTRPGRDEKILTAWNALMITAFAEAASVLNRDDYRQVAVRASDFLLTNLRRDGALLRTYRDGKAKINAYLEDYAFFTEALLAVYEATFSRPFLDQACSLASATIDLFSDETDAGFFFTAPNQEELIVRTKDFFDNAIPSGNSVACLTMLKLALLTGESPYQRPALATLRKMREAMGRHPSGFGYLLCGLDFYLSQPKELALVGPADSHEIRSFATEIFRRYIPNKVVALAEPGDDQEGEALGLLRGKQQVDGKPAAYVCSNYVCLSPVTTPEELALQLE